MDLKSVKSQEHKKVLDTLEIFFNELYYVCKEKYNEKRRSI